MEMGERSEFELSTSNMIIFTYKKMIIFKSLIILKAYSNGKKKANLDI